MDCLEAQFDESQLYSRYILILCYRKKQDLFTYNTESLPILREDRRFAVFCLQLSQK
jgi:hypothetical protein